MTELEIILPINPANPSIWTVIGLCLVAGTTPLWILAGVWWWLSEPMSNREIENVLRKR